MADLHVHCEWGGPEPEVREAVESLDPYDLEDLTVAELADHFAAVSRLPRRSTATGRRKPPPGMGTLAHEAVERRLRFREKLSLPLETELLFD